MSAEKQYCALCSTYCLQMFVCMVAISVMWSIAGNVKCGTGNIVYAAQYGVLDYIMVFLIMLLLIFFSFIRTGISKQSSHRANTTMTSYVFRIIYSSFHSNMCKVVQKRHCFACKLCRYVYACVHVSGSILSLLIKYSSCSTFSLRLLLFPAKVRYRARFAE